MIDPNEEFNSTIRNSIEILINTLLEEESFEIGVSSNGDTFKGSIISSDVYDSDRQIIILLSPDNTLHLTGFYFNEEQELVKFSYLLEPIEIEMIPKGLLELMKQVLNDREETTYYHKTVNK